MVFGVGNWKSTVFYFLHRVSFIMPGETRFEPSSIKNKIKRGEVARKAKKAKSQHKLQQRLAQAKFESTNPAAKEVSGVVILQGMRIDTTCWKETPC
jgi:hypothetical protein